MRFSFKRRWRELALEHFQNITYYRSSNLSIRVSMKQTRAQWYCLMDHPQHFEGEINIRKRRGSWLFSSGIIFWNKTEKRLSKAIKEERPKAEIVKLIQQGASVNAADQKGQTPLHLVSMVMEETKDYVELVSFVSIIPSYLSKTKLLVQKGANVNSKDSTGLYTLRIVSNSSIGWTPLHCCCFAGNLNIILFLLKSIKKYPPSSKLNSFKLEIWRDYPWISETR